jgi:oligoribonuclease NrnB/cAMP/cGMP phosphodiesterase (DHH superfamily)
MLCIKDIDSLAAYTTTMSKNILCIYHGTCMDGFTAAWVVRRALGADVEFYAATHGDPPPDVKGKNVIIVDFSYKRSVLLEMARQARSMLVLDHHKSAELDLHEKPSDEQGPQIMRMDAWKEQSYRNFQQNLFQDDCENANSNGAVIYALFDMNRSGAGIAWDFFMGEARTEFIDMVEDRDLWRWKVPNSRAACANIFSHEYTFENWDMLANHLQSNRWQFFAEGLAIERKHHKDIAELVKKSVRTMTIGEYNVPAANLPYTMGSDAGHLMCGLVTDAEDPDTRPRFAAYYWDGPDGRTFGLRSLEDGADVSEIAKVYGGGGHKHAAGFRVPFGHELTK